MVAYRGLPSPWGELLRSLPGGQSYFAMVLILTTLMAPALLFATGLIWVIEAQNQNRWEVLPAQVVHIGERPAEQTVVRFVREGQEILKRLKRDTPPAATKVGDRFEILFDGKSEPHPSMGFGLHETSLVTGLLGVIVLAITLIGRVIWRVSYRKPFQLSATLSLQNEEGERLYGTGGKLSAIFHAMYLSGREKAPSIGRESASREEDKK